MIFGKIEYLNLLPFHVFMKRFTRSSQESMSMHYKKGVPTKINTQFALGKIDAAFISVIHARKYSSVNLGIIAKKEVLSVLVKPSKLLKKDRESATANILALLLGIQGEVIIGDKALSYYLTGKEHIDLAKYWSEKYKQPFVFALLCHRGNKKTYIQIEKQFTKSNIKIPRYILNIASKKTGIEEEEILNYLKYISYKLDKKAKRGLHTFYALLQRSRV